MILFFGLLALWIVVQLTHEFLIWMTTWWSRWKVRCEGCDGTGLCTAPNPLFPHSCDGDCRRIYVPESWVPADFKGNWHEPGERLVGTDNVPFWPFPKEISPDINERYAFIGCGWVRGSLWQRLVRGGPRKLLGVQTRPSSKVTTTPSSHHPEHDRAHKVTP
jgi:hypothetical protein